MPWISGEPSIVPKTNLNSRDHRAFREETTYCLITPNLDTLGPTPWYDLSTVENADVWKERLCMYACIYAQLPAVLLADLLCGLRHFSALIFLLWLLAMS